MFHSLVRLETAQSANGCKKEETEKCPKEFLFNLFSQNSKEGSKQVDETNRKIAKRSGENRWSRGYELNLDTLGFSWAPKF